MSTLTSTSPAHGQVTGADALQSRVRTELAVFTNWLAANGARLSQQFHTDPGVVGYGLINEPVGMPALAGLTSAQTWSGRPGGL